MLAAYFDQFNVIRLITIHAFLGDMTVTLTNSSMMIILGVTIIGLLLKGERLIPNR